MFIGEIEYYIYLSLYFHKIFIPNLYLLLTMTHIDR